MAESVKRRVAAARLAVAFVAAGTIAGASAWAQASPPAPTAKSSALNAYLKLKGLTSANIADGSLLYKDFKKYEVPSEAAFKHFEKVVFNKYYPKVEIDRNFIKGQSSDYIKHQEFDGLYMKYGEADARYMKLDASVMHGDGSVLTATRLLPTVNKVTLLDVPGKFTVDTTGPTVTITNTSNAPLVMTSCPNGAGGVSVGKIAPGASADCDDSNSQAPLTLQLIGGDGSVATLNYSAVSVQGGTQSTVQILIGL